MTDAHTNVTILAIVSCRITKNLPSEPSNARTSHIDCRAPLPAAGPLSALVLVPAQPSRRTEIQPAQRIQAKPDLNWRIVRARSHRRLRVPTRSILQPISDSQRPFPSLPLLKAQKKPLERTRAMQHATATNATLLTAKSRASRGGIRVNIIDAVQRSADRM